MRPGYRQPLPVSSRPLSGPALQRCVAILSRAQFDTLRGPPSFLPVSQRTKPPLCVPTTSPSARPPPAISSLPRGNGEAVRPTLCGNPGASVLMSCPQLQAKLSVPGMLLPPCGKGLSLGSGWPLETMRKHQAFTANSFLMHSSKGYRDRK